MIQEEKNIWTDELVLMAIDHGHHNGFHKNKQTCLELFHEIKKQAEGAGYDFRNSWIKEATRQPKDSREPNKAIKVKIIKGNGWYQNAIGKEFEVIKYSSSYVFLLDYQRGYSVEWRHIDFEDCDVIQPPKINNYMIEKFRLKGLNGGRKECYATLEIGKEDWFHANFDETFMPPDRQVALFNLFKEGDDNIWKRNANTKAVVQFDKYSSGNMPINPVIIGIEGLEL